ncbi:Rrf2 family transcriptional regulator [Mycoplasma sp. 005V]|uniref:Rrf2 family transcriptional regulator n=1 Tax=unclassified Mycoplasma TaxID=2683645 RepID=UPI003A847C8A
MVSITYKKTELKYGFSDFISLLHILTILGHKKTAMSSSEIAENANINPVKVRLILQAMNNNDWIKKSRGRKGGYTLNVDLKDIKCSDLLDVLNLKLINKTWASGLKDSECVISRNIEAVEQDLINSLNNVVYENLKNKTLEDIKKEILSKGGVLC